LTERSIAQEDKRRRLLDAAVRVFARKGYHSSRVGDIAEEAGVAHGLLYHYFESKEALLQAVSRDTWTQIMESIREIEERGGPAGEQLRRVAALFLRAWARDPDLVRVLVREVARSPQVQRQVEEVGAVFDAIRGIIERGQAAGEFRDDVDPQFASWIFYGAIEEVLTAWVLGQLPDGDEEVALAERTILEVIRGGLARADAASD